MIKKEDIETLGDLEIEDYHLSFEALRLIKGQLANINKNSPYLINGWSVKHKAYIN